MPHYLETGKGLASYQVKNFRQGGGGEKRVLRERILGNQLKLRAISGVLWKYIIEFNIIYKFINMI